MNNHYTDLLLKIDLVLAGVAILLFLFIIAYSAGRSFYEKSRNKRLIKIKTNLKMLMVPTDISAASHAGVKTSEEFLDVETNRAAILFSEAERQTVKSYILSSGKIDAMRRSAGRSHSKWHRIESILSLGYAEDASSIEIIKHGLFNKDEDVSYYAMHALGLIKIPRSADALIGYLKYDTSRARKIASILESFPQEEEIADKIIDLTNDKDPVVRYWAVRLAHRFCSKNCPINIEGLATDSSADVRAATCEYLGYVSNVEAVKILDKCLKDKTWFVRMRAVTALSKILGPKALPGIASLINDSSLMVKDSVKRVIADHIKEALPLIHKIFLGTDELAKEEAVEALEMSGYVTKICNDIISGDEKKISDAVKVLKEMVEAHAHLGIESALAGFNKSEQADILKVVKDNISVSFAEHIEKKIKMEISEV